VSSDSEIDDLLQQQQQRRRQQQQQQQHRRRTMPVIDKIRIIERLSTDSLDPDSILEQQRNPTEDGINGTEEKGGQVRRFIAAPIHLCWIRQKELIIR
jgi:hypothetical protein